jgi:DNA-directed RNA polymerase specialized sigma24 family protein
LRTHHHVVSSSGSDIELLLADCAQHLRRLLAALREEPDVAERLGVTSRALEQLRDESAAVAALRDECIVALASDGMSYQRIATASGITKGRVAHIVAEGRRF